MTRLFMTGMEDGGMGLWTSSNGANNIATLPRTGSRCLQVGTTTANQNWYASKDLGANYQDLYLRFGVRLLSSAYGFLLYLKDSANARQLHIDVCSGGALAVKRGTGTGTLLVNPTGCLAIGEWYCIEVYVRVADAPNGIFRVKVNGVQIISFTGDTQETANANVRYVHFGTGNTINANAANCVVDDIAIDDAAWIGRGGIYPLLPNGPSADGAGHTQFAPSAGANWQCVDEVPVSTVDYVSDATVDHKDTYTVSAVTPTTGTVAAALWSAWAKVDSGAINLARLIRRVTDDQGVDQAMTTSYARYKELLLTDPIAVGAWTIDNLNATEFGEAVG